MPKIIRSKDDMKEVIELIQQTTKEPFQAIVNERDGTISLVIRPKKSIGMKVLIKFDDDDKTYALFGSDASWDSLDYANLEDTIDAMETWIEVMRSSSHP